MEDPKPQQPALHSPDVSSIQLGDCIDELLRAVLEWSLNGTLGFDIGLSREFCTALLDQGINDGHSSAFLASSSTDFSGVPLYPLYKSLASALDQSIVSGSLFSRYNEASQESLSMPMKEEWEDLLLYKGSELLSILKNINFQLNVQEPFFSQLKDGSKTVEGRCAVGDYNRICTGDLIMFNKCLVMKVLEVRHYISFAKMLETEGLNKVLPGVTLIKEEIDYVIVQNGSREKHITKATRSSKRRVIKKFAPWRSPEMICFKIGVGVYRNFYTEEKEKINDVIAIAVSKIASQPYTVLANIIASLSYQGIQSLLGFQHTTGTVTEALSPARSTLLSSFVHPHRPNDVL
ncbi:hypothetical protein V2J09_022689 [Rumex salicifolius]